MTAQPVAPQRLPARRWDTRAACLGQDTELWFAPRHARFAGSDHRCHPGCQMCAALAVCAVCVVKADCLADALHDEGTLGVGLRFGVRGGVTAAGRAGLARRALRERA